MFYLRSWSHPKPNMQNPFISVTCVLLAFVSHTDSFSSNISSNQLLFSTVSFQICKTHSYWSHVYSRMLFCVTQRVLSKSLSYNIWTLSDGQISQWIREAFTLSKYSATDILHKSVCYLLAFQTYCLFAIYVAIYIFCCHTVNMMKQLLKYILQNILLIYGYIIPKSTFNCSSSCSKLFRSLQWTIYIGRNVLFSYSYQFIKFWCKLSGVFNICLLAFQTYCLFAIYVAMLP